MSTEIGLAAALFACVTAGVIASGLFLFGRRGAIAARNSPPAPPAMKLLESPASSLRRALAAGLGLMGERLPAVKNDAPELQRRLLSAGFRWPSGVAVVYGLRAAAALLLMTLTGWVLVLLKQDLAGAAIPALCAAGFGYLIPDRVLEWLTRARARRLRSGLPAAMDMLVLTIESGQALETALHDTARALAPVYPDLGSELMFAQLEIRAGKSKPDALKNLARRSPEPELEKLASLLADSDRFGVSLAPTLRSHARVLRTRLRHQTQTAARKLSVKLVFPIFFLIFPSILLVTLGPAYLKMRELLGQLLGG